MNTVDMTDFVYPCATYALRRTGSSKTIGQLLREPGMRYAPSKLEVGDIVCWKRTTDIETFDSVYLMAEHGPVTTKVVFDKHFAVYEGDGIISDTTYYNATAPCIRQRKLNDVTEPDYIIKAEE